MAASGGAAQTRVRNRRPVDNDDPEIGSGPPARLRPVTGDKSVGNSRADGITFLLTGEGRPVPFLAFEADTVVLETPEGSTDPIDAVVNLYLEKGFALVTGPLLAQIYPELPGWALRADGEGVTLWDDYDVIAFTAGRGNIEVEWIDAVRLNGMCRVITGTGLAIRKGDLWAGLDQAIANGALVGAAVGVTEDRQHPKI